MTNADRFIDKYKQLEEAVRLAYDLRNEDSITSCIMNKEQFKNYREEFQYCKEVRNLLSHKKKVNNCFAVEPSDAMIEFLDSLIERIKNRPKCYQIQIKLKDVYWQPLNGKVRDTLGYMYQKSYRCTPILNDKGVVVGIFDTDSFLSYIAVKGIDSLSEDLRFSDIYDHICLESKKANKFIFVKSDSYADELEERIEEVLKSGVRTELAIVTSTGSKNEKMLGIITPWEIIKI